MLSQTNLTNDLCRLIKVYNAINPNDKDLKESLSSFYAVNKKILKIPILPGVYLLFICYFNNR